MKQHDPRHTLAVLAAALAVAGAPPAAAQGLFEEAVQQRTKPAPSSRPSEATSGEDSGGARSAGVAGGVGGIGFELNGHLRGDLYLGRIPERRATEVKSGYGELALKARARKGDHGDAYGELRFRAGYEGGERQLVVDLREAYVNAYLGPVDLRVGHQIVIWGRADGVNPTNNLTPRDMRVRSPLEDDMRLANFAVRAYLDLAPVRLEAVWLPFFAASHFPRFELPGGIALGEPEYPSANLRNGTLAGRAHLELSALELSLSYLAGTATFPGIALLGVDPAAGVPPAISVAFASYRHQVVGGDFSTSVGSFGVRGEVALHWPFGYTDAEYKPLPDLQYVLGVDRELFGQLSIIAQYSGRTVFDWDHDPLATTFADRPLLEQVALEQIVARNRMIAGQLQRVQHSVTLRAELRLLQEALRIELLGMANLSTEELLLRPKISYDLADAFTATIGAEIYLGADNTLFGMIEQTQTAGYAELRASF